MEQRTEDLDDDEKGVKEILEKIIIDSISQRLDFSLRVLSQ